jgi:eukaryotic-like serine/threonine-protein kinase
MELMPGATLKDLVEQQGPLAPAQAVTLILDVMEGLQEAHQNGVIHRDVKPSNCFLQADGRVKIGDFGLSKSLTAASHLTRTGTFLGTPLFASPEQVRGEAVDHQSDVYSVAATLYYLLTGKAPFESVDAAITLARLVSDPAPPMRSVRPDLPAALDRVVLRGLERPRDRRWRSLEALRAALLPFVPSRLSIGGMGIRLVAYLIDVLVLMPFTWVLVVFALAGSGRAPLDSLDHWLAQVLPALCYLAYYGVLEGLWGCSLGKRWLRLRVCRMEGMDPPGAGRGLLRAFFWNVCLNGPSLAYHWVYSSADLAANPVLVFLTPLPLLAGIILVLCTMRARNGYRGPYEFLSGTRVVQLPWPSRRRIYQSRDFDRSLVQPQGLPAQVGPFAVQGALCWSPATRVLLAEDKALGRKVWLWLRPLSAPPLSAVRREVGRATRLRWLSTGGHEDFLWDAFLAPTGTLVGDLAERVGPLNWADTRPLLELLTEELAVAAADGTLPTLLTVEQVWVQPNGRLHLLDMPLRDAGTVPGSQTTDTDPARALAVLGQVAVLLLEGRLRPAAAPARPVRAPVPRHAETFLKRLVGGGEPYTHILQFQAALAATHDQPAEVSRSRRAVHLVFLTLLLLCGSGCCLMPIFVSPGNARLTILAFQIPEASRTLTQLDTAAGRDLVAGLLNPAPTGPLAAVAQWHEDKVLGDRLREKLSSWHQELEARRKALSWSSNLLFAMNDAGPKQDDTRKVLWQTNHLRTMARSLLETDQKRERQMSLAMVWVALTMLAIWPAVWVIWAFATRGGLSYGLAGIALARTTGGRPSRWRCAWRSLLFWTPLFGLAAVSILLDAWFWEDWHPAAEDAISSWLPLLSMASWWAAVLLLPLYAGLALLWPARSVHDRLAGTCLVPR